MKTKSWLYGLMLIVWMGGSTYWYVCKIKHHCKETPKEENTQVPIIEQKSQRKIDLEVEKDSLLNIADKTKEKKTKELEEKLAAGFIVSDFPPNASQKNQISNDFNKFADNLKQYISIDKDATIELIGNTDNVGSEQANLILGEKRADFIKTKLLEAGIPEQNIVLHTKGESEPIQPNSTNSGKAKNRRVEIKLLKQ